MEQIKKTIDQINSCIQKYKHALKSYPYNINIIDELHADENAHSRILMRLLQYKEDNTYPILSSFMKELDINETIAKPVFTSDDSDRIDLLVKDEKYALIIENKIHGAPDQNQQIKRYIEEIKRKGIMSFYVIYITKNGDSPNDKSLSKERQKELKNDGRFHTIGYRDNILPWMEQKILPTCRIKEENLISALKQYIDHLKGLFMERYIDKELNKTIEEHILSELKIKNKSSEDKIKSLHEFIFEINKVSERVDKIRREEIFQYFSKWKLELLEKYSNQFDRIEDNFITEKNGFTNNYPRLGVVFEYMGKKFECIIETEITAKKDPYIAFWSPKHTRYKEINAFLNDNKESIHKNLQINYDFKIDEDSKTGWFYTMKLRHNYYKIMNEFKTICDNTTKAIELSEKSNKL